MARVIQERKTVHDAVHGSLDIGGLFLELMDSAEFQRLKGIHQLGLANLVFPGANHTRLEHSLGTWHVGSRMVQETKVEEGATELAAACMLHDVGHAPYSHTLEYILQEELGQDHEEVTREVIRGDRDMLRRGERSPGLPSVAEILERSGLEPKEVAGLVSEGSCMRPEAFLERFESPRRSEGRRHLGQLLHGALDADQLDYLLRDARYTGVAYGVIDLPRLLRVLAFRKGQLVALKSGLAAVENMLVARALMFTSVYFHRTVRIGEMMLARAVERLDGLKELDIPRMIDSELMQLLASAGGYQRDIALRLKYRRLFKRAHSISAAGLPQEQAERLAALDDRRHRLSVEKEIARLAKVDEGYVIVDLPSKELLLSEPRMRMVDVMIYDEERDKLLPLSKFSPLARALQLRLVPDWAVMVSTEEGSVEAVARAAKRVLA